MLQDPGAQVTARGLADLRPVPGGSDCQSLFALATFSESNQNLIYAGRLYGRGVDKGAHDLDKGCERDTWLRGRGRGAGADKGERRRSAISL